jgi:hypothetical protein
MFAIPFKIYEGMRKEIDALNKPDYLKSLLSGIIFMVGFYFGAAGVAGLMSGVFTIPNMTGALSILNRVGVDTGQLSSALRLIGLTGGDLSSITGVTSTVNPSAMDADFWADVGIDPGGIGGSDIDFGELFGGGFDAGAGFGDDFWSEIGLDPASISYEGIVTGDDASWWLSESLGYDAESILREQDIALENAGLSEAADSYADTEMLRFMRQQELAIAGEQGPVSLNQIGGMTSTLPQAMQAAQTIMRATGGDPNSTRTTPQQAQRAAQAAAGQAEQARRNGDPQSAGVFDLARQALQLFGQYQQVANPRQPTPARPAQPGTSPGNRQRQPDGSISLRNPDGSVTTLAPDGRVVVGNGVPSWVTQNKTLLLAGGAAVLVLGAVMLSRK